MRATGTGFSADVSANRIILTPASGAAVAIPPTSLTTIDATRDLRALNFVVPSGLAIGPATIAVTNLLTGEQSPGGRLEILALRLPEIASAPAGAANLDVRVQALGNAAFVAGRVRAVFGAGVTVVSTTVETASSLLVRISVAATAAPGPRGVSVIASTQTLMLTNGFLITDTGSPSNRAPVANANGPYSGLVGQPVVFSSAGSSDPDGDPLTYEWMSGDGQNTTGPSPSISYAVAGNYTATLTVRDNHGGTATATAAVTITTPPPQNHPPTVSIAGPSSGAPSVALEFTATASDPDNDPLTLSWTFGDGATGTGTPASHAWTAAGPFTVTVTADDGRGGSASASQVVTITTPPPQNHPPVARPGGPYSTTTGAALTFAGGASSDPDGDALTFSWNFGDQSAAGTGPTPTHSYAAEGSFTVTLTVTDPYGAAGAATTTVNVGSPADTTPPTVTLNAPREVLPGAQVTVTAQAFDNVRVDAVRFEVQNDQASESPAEPYRRTFTVPQFAAPGQTILVRAIARDPSNNTGRADATVTVTAQPDTAGPVVALTVPRQSSPGATVRLVAAATDDVGVASVVFFAGATEIGATSTSPYEMVYAIPADAQVGGSVPFTARAVDFSGNSGEDSASTAIVGTPDNTPPSVMLIAPTQVVVGSRFGLSAAAADDGGVASVTFYVNGVPVATDVAPPYEADVPFPIGTLPGASLAVVARAFDLANLSASDEKAVVVVAPPALSRGVLRGEVYDDTTGLPLAGVTVALAGVDAAGRSYDAQTTTDARGRFVLRGTEGSARVRFSRDGWTSAMRLAAVTPGRAVDVFDARLTPLAAATPVQPLTGGTVGADPARLVIPGAALASGASVAVTPLGQQGLRGLLPPGWVPAGMADVTPPAILFSGGATLRVANSYQLPAGIVLTVVAWDDADAAWRVVGTTTIAGNASFLEMPVPSTGQYAFLLADTQPSAPPSGVPGALLEGVQHPVVPSAVDTLVNPQPRVLFYRPGVNSAVRGTLGMSAPVSSGAHIWARISETYTYFTGARANPDPFTQDLTFFQVPGTATTLAAGYIVSPSLTFEALSLERGVITVAQYVPGSGGAGAQLVGADGGLIAGPGGEALVLPPGAVADATPFELRSLVTSDLGVDVPADVTLIAGVDVNFAGVLGVPAGLGVPAPAGFTSADAERTFLVRLQQLGGQTRFVLVGLARLNGDTIGSDLTFAGAPTFLDGVGIAGRYLFLRAADTVGPLGFARGTVLAVGGGPFSGALVSSGLPVVSLSGASGLYFALSRAGAATLSALDLDRADAGSVDATIPAGQAPAIDIPLVTQPPRVTSLAPADGAVDVPLSDAIVAVFSEPIAPATVSGANAANAVLTLEGGGVVPASLALGANNTRLVLRPAAPLAPRTRYVFTLSRGITDVSGNALDRAYAVTFESLDTDPPPPPAAGAIAASIPTNGITTITATQGTAGVRDTVRIVNTRNGAVTPVLVEPNGSFTVFVSAQMGDKLRLQIRGPAGTETVVDLPRFRRENPDGSVSEVVGDEGGIVEGPGGVAAGVPAGALPAGTVVTLRPVSEAEFPVQLTAQDRQNFSYSGGVSIDFGGAAPQQYLDLYIPAGGDETREERWVVTHVVDVGGSTALDVVDTASLIGPRIRTASPPCPGVLAAGVYGFLRAGVDVGMGYGQMSGTDYGGVAVSVEIAQVGLVFPVPYLAFAPVEPRNVCIPVLSGRVTVVPNTVRVRVPGAELAPADRLVIVRNGATSADGYYTRNVAEFAYTIAGRDTDTYQITATGPGGQVPVPLGTLAAAGTSQVRITIDPDQITVPITQIDIVNVRTSAAQTFPVATPDVEFGVEGSIADAFTARARNAAATERPVSSTTLPPAAGTGNLVLKIRAGTLDPTRAELDAHVTDTTPPVPDPIHLPGRDRVQLYHDPDGAGPLPEALVFDAPGDDPRLVRGGGEIAFDGTLDGLYNLVVRYDTVYGYRPADSIPVRTFRLTLTNPVTGRVLKTVTVPAPPRDQPMVLPPLTNDTTPPFLISGPPRVDNFDPTGYFSFTFSESMNAVSLRQAFRVDVKVGSTYRQLTNGDIRVSNENKVLTFLPANGLKLGAEYRITLAGNDAVGHLLVPGAGLGIRDRSDNGMSSVVFTIRTAAPRITGRLHNDTDPDLDGQPPLFNPFPPNYAPFKDVSFVRKTVSGVPKTTLFITAGEYSLHDKFITVDVTDPSAPKKLRRAAGDVAPRRQRAVVLQNVSFPTWRDRACVASPPPAGPSACPPGTFTGDIAVATTFNPTYSFISIYDVTNVEQPTWLSNKLLTVDPGSVTDYNRRGTVKQNGYAKGIALLRDASTVFAFAAVERTGIFAVSLSDNLPERGATERLTDPLYSGDFTDITAFGDKLLALERTEKRLYVFDPSLSVQATLDLPDEPRRIATVRSYTTDANRDGLLEPSENFDLAIVGTSSSLLFVDLSQPASPALLGSVTMPGIVRDISVDPVKRRLFVAGEKSSTVGDTQLFLVDFTDPRQTFGPDVDGDTLDDRIIWTSGAQANGVEADPERGVLYATTDRGLDVWLYETCCDLGTDTAQVLPDRPKGARAAVIVQERDALKQAIAAGLTAATTACTGFTGTGISMLEQGSGACLWKTEPEKACADNYQPGVSDHDFEVFVPPAMLVPGGSTPSTAACVIDTLTAQFIDPVTKQPRPVVLPGGAKVTFEDITFFPVSRDEFEAARLNLLPPASGGSDPIGDMGLGRQQLLLKWLLEGEYITVPGFTLSGVGLETILTRLKTTGIPALEGYEWSVLQEAQLAKAKNYIRIKGSSSSTSSMHEFFIKQMHDAGKAGIRAALARMVADTQANPIVLDITRADYARDACVIPTQLLTNPNDWTAKACTSFEEYIAAAAARTLRRTIPLTLFTASDVKDVVYRFYRVKSDLETIPSDAAADSFIQTVAAFIQQSKLLTESAYNAGLVTDPQAPQRIANMADAGTKLVTLLSDAKVHIKPHVFNRGFRAAQGIEIKYLAQDAGASGGAVERRSLRLDLAGGDDRYLDFERRPDGTLVLDTAGKAQPLFVLGPIDQRMHAGQAGHAAFTVDLPGRVMKEADRQNNFDGYFYYTLPLTGSVTPPVTAAKVPFPLADPALLNPDSACGDQSPLRITQRITRQGGEVLSGAATVGLGEQLTIRLVVENLSGLAHAGGTACSSLANVCYTTGPLAPAQTWTKDIPYTVPTSGVIADGVATLISPTDGVLASTQTRLIASCELYQVLPLDPNPNPDEGSIGRNGTALRYFRVVNRRDNAPIASATVNLELKGTDSAGHTGLYPFTYTTDAQGLVKTTGQRGAAIPFTGGPAAYHDGTAFRLSVGQVNGVAPVCETTDLATIKLNDLEYGESYSRGSSIEGSIGFIASVEGAVEGGTEVERTDKVTETGTQPKSVEVERALSLSGKVGVGFDLFKFSGKAGIVKATLSAEAGTNTKRQTDWKTKWGFTYPLDATANCNLADITLSGLWGVNPVFTKLIDLARSTPCVNLDRNLKSSSTTFGREATAQAEIGLKFDGPFSRSRPAPGDPAKDGIALSFGATGSSGYSVETSHEMSYAYDAASGLPNETGNKEEYKLKGGFDWNASVGLARSEIDADPARTPAEKTEDKQKAEVEFDALKASLGASASGTTAETFSVAFEWDFTKPGLPWPNPSTLSVTHAGPKKSGIKLDVGGVATNLTGPANGKRSYKFENPDDIGYMVSHVPNFQSIRDSNVGAGVLRQLLFEPTQLTIDLGTFLASLNRVSPSYEDTEERAVGGDFPIGIEGKLAGFTLGLGVGLKGEGKVKYTKERGVILQGTEYPLEKYSPSLFPAPSLQIWRSVEQTWDALISSFSSQFSDKQATVGTGGGTTTLRSDFTATLTIDNSAEPVPFDAGLFSYRYEPRPADPAIDVRLLPSDTFGPEGAPHYGVGGFHQFWPDGRMLAVPTRLVIDYHDEEVAGFDESTLAVYRWNKDRQDWDYVGGTIDQAANTVTTFIRQLGLYTLGIQMPAGAVPLIFMNGGQSGTFENTVQRFQVITDTLTLNTGGPVPDGTVYTVRSVYAASGSDVPYGRVIATDVDPVREGVQVASQNGSIAFDVEFPAPYGNYQTGRIVVYASRGTAAGEALLVR